MSARAQASVKNLISYAILVYYPVGCDARASLLPGTVVVRVGWCPAQSFCGAGHCVVNNRLPIRTHAGRSNGVVRIEPAVHVFGGKIRVVGLHNNSTAQVQFSSYAPG